MSLSKTNNIKTNREKISSDFLFQSLSNAKWIQKYKSSFDSVGIDSRQVLKNKIFFAIKGETFNGHDFLTSALKQGAKTFVVSDLKNTHKILKNKKIAVILVPDTLKALTELASSWRQFMQFQVLGITGSNGKSSTRYFTQTLLSSLSPFASPKSYNNAIGVSLSLLNANKKKSLVIQEIGSNKPGEIAFLTSLSQPNIATVTMIGPSHLEGLKTLTAIAKEKQDIYLKSPKARWIFNLDNPWTQKMHKNLKQKTNTLSFSTKNKKASVYLYFVKQELNQSQIKGQIGNIESQTSVSFFGQQNLDNLMCACTLALAAGLNPKKIWQEIPKCQNLEGRQDFFTIPNKKLSICFDAYNANPSSMKFFLDICKKISKGKNRVLILGDMKELGKQANSYHKRLAKNKNLLSSKVVVFIGEYGHLIKEELKKQNYKGYFKAYKNYSDTIIKQLRHQIKQGDFIGIKASRSLKLEKLFQKLTEKEKLEKS